MAKAIGIDLGTTNSVVGVMEDGKPVVIINSEGNRLTPSILAFTKTGERLVGQLAKRQAVLNPDRTISSAKRFIGRRYAEVQSESKNVPYKVVAGPNDAVRFAIEDKLYAPEEVSAQVLRKLADDATKCSNTRRVSRNDDPGRSAGWAAAPLAQARAQGAPQ